MYRKPRFLEMLHAIQEEMSREADYDVELFAEMTRSGEQPRHGPERNVRGYKSRAPHATKVSAEQSSSPPQPSPQPQQRPAARRKRATR